MHWPNPDPNPVLHQTLIQTNPVIKFVGCLAWSTNLIVVLTNDPLLNHIVPEWRVYLIKAEYKRKTTVFGNRFTFFSGDFVAKTGMWQASSGHEKGAIVLPSFSPHSQPGEFSSPEIEIKKETISISSLLLCPYFAVTCTYWHHTSHPQSNQQASMSNCAKYPAKRSTTSGSLCNMNGIISMRML